MMNTLTLDLNEAQSLALYGQSISTATIKRITREHQEMFNQRIRDPGNYRWYIPRKITLNIIYKKALKEHEQALIPHVVMRSTCIDLYEEIVKAKEEHGLTGMNATVRKDVILSVENYISKKGAIV